MIKGGYAVHVSVRVRPELARRLDDMARASGLSRSQFLRLVLGRLNAHDVPPGLIEHGRELQAARTLAP